MEIEKDKPFYPVSMAAQILGISADRLRTYEKAGLVKPHRIEKKSEKQKGEKRLYSQNDIEWVAKLRELIKSGISIPALKIIINLLPYWERANSPEIFNLKDDKEWKLIQELAHSPVYKSLIGN